MVETMPQVSVKKRTTQLAGRRTALAFDRNRMAADRTLMAWIRTAVSLISFGFTIFKFFQYTREAGEFTSISTQGPRNLGVTMVILGTLLLAVAIVEYFLYLRRLTAEAHRTFPKSPALIAAFLISLLGFLALINVFFHIGPL